MRCFSKFQLVHQVRGWFSGAVAELAILEGASEGPYHVTSASACDILGLMVRQILHAPPSRNHCGIAYVSDQQVP
jgi:hypothetical protein